MYAGASTVGRIRAGDTDGGKMSTERAIDRCRCGRPLFPYWYRQEGGEMRVYAQKPIIPGPAEVVWACDLAEARSALGLWRATRVHDVHFESDRSRDQQGACMNEAWRVSTPMSQG